MENIPQEKLENVAKNTSGLISTVNEGVEWVDSYLKDEIQIDTSDSLKRNRRKLKRIRRAITQKPAIALFGASQVGKSYLVKNVLSDDKNNLMIMDHRDGKENVNFIRDMNPEGGGTESTSVVTRFTYDANPSQDKLPVKIRLLSAKDLIIILCDSYLSDIKKQASTRKDGKEDLMELLDEELPELCGNDTQKDLDEDDVYEIQEYIEAFFTDSHRARLDQFDDAKYWRKVASSIHKVAPRDWSSVFGVLWNKNPRLTRLFRNLVDELQKTRFARLVYTDFKAVLRDEGTILDVKRLKQLSEPRGGGDVVVKDGSGTAYTMVRSRLCALTAEVILNISKESVAKHPFINKTDILDFPGARTRLRLDEEVSLGDEDDGEEDIVPMMMLRGKVAYLFNSYSLNYEISNLFVCTHSVQSNVKGLPELIKNWIYHNIGETTKKRTNTLAGVDVPPLFLIFTWWNNQLIFDKDNDGGKEKFDYKWKARFEILFNEEIMGTFDWNKGGRWTSNSAFQNFYLLRDFKYSKDIFTDFEEKGQEGTVREIRKEYYEKLRHSFQKSSLVRGFFPDPEKTWQETSTPEYDGSQAIIGEIQKVANNNTKTTRYLGMLNEVKAEIEEELKRHHHSDKSDEQIRKAARQGADIHARMNKIFGIDAFNFGAFIEQLTIKEKSIYKLYHDKLTDKELVSKESTNKYTLYRESSPRLSLKKSFEENLKVLTQDYHRDSDEETKKYFQEDLGIDLQELFFGELNNLKNKSTVLAESARDYWFESVLNTANFDFFIEKGFSKGLLQSLFDNFKTNFKRLHLTRVIAENIRSYVDRYNKVDAAEDMIAHITAGLINEFVNSVGWSFYPDSDKEKIRDTNMANNLNLIFPDEVEVFESLDKESIIELFDFMAELNENLSKVSIDTETIKNVPMIRNYRRWRELMKISFITSCDIPTYNVEANKILGKIIDSVMIYNFAV